MMQRLLTLMSEKKASDLFLSPGSPVQMKINGHTLAVDQQRLDPARVTALIREVVTERQWSAYEQSLELNMGYGLRGVGSFRINVFQQRGSPACVVRYIPGDIPRFASLNLPESLLELITVKTGLILVVGSTGCGKSTTVASLLDYRNEQSGGHILTLEDPIEYTFQNKRSIVNQRQIGTDTASLPVALRNAMRQAPDCIFIGEIREVETMTAALAYAQAGHLVISTLHANNAHNALNRIVNFYAPENRRVLLADLSASLRAIVSQRLVRTLQGSLRPAVEVLLNTRHSAELIEQGRLSEARDAMENSLAAGSQTFEQSLLRLVQEQLVSREEALANADSATNLMWLFENSELSDTPALAPRPPARSAPPAARPAESAPGPSFSDFLLSAETPQAASVGATAARPGPRQPS
jgi:twitching motility protein PilU